MGRYNKTMAREIVQFDAETFQKELLELMEKHKVLSIGAIITGEGYSTTYDFGVETLDFKEHILNDCYHYIDQADIKSNLTES